MTGTSSWPSILGEKGKEIRRFENSMDMDDINSLMAWLKGRKFRHMVMEASGIYWVHIAYSVLEEVEFEFVLASARQ